ncbi:baseplate J/gp47 family protein [Indiicoccus explosivorum]|uniref:baseplate J/gp47 family protein n=1 Tax=Indiicoccus explosivorum TaxID=1917864 RepID=UPI000B43A6D7|nr:baseplate J/gp47 family protein [Indiicoccus explosivorum]
MLDKFGYRRKTYDEILMEIENKARELFGESIQLGKKSVLGILLMIMAWFLSLVWKDNEDVYYSAYVGTATDKNLDRLLPYGGIRRNPARYAIGTITISGTAGFEVPAGFVVATEADVFFETTESVVLDGVGNGTAPIQAQVTGRSGNVATGAILVIVNPSANIHTVTNPEPTTGGRERETDQELRERFGLTVEGLGAATLPAIRSKLLKVPDVRAAAVIENNLAVTDSEGRPPHSFQAYVLGGADQEIAEIIFNSKAGGIRPFGDVLVQVEDDAGHVHDVAFSRAEEILVRVRLSITKNTSFPVDGGARIRQTLIQFVGGEDAGGALYAGLNMGEDVIYSKLIAQIFKVPGIEDITLSLSTDGMNYAEGNIAISSRQVAQTADDFIEVTINV